MTGDQEWRCRYCQRWSVVASLRKDHEAVCPLNPQNRQTTRGWTR